MKNTVLRYTVILFVLVLCLCTTKMFPCTHCDSESPYAPFAEMTEDKHYIRPGSLVFSEAGLFLIMHGNLIPISGLEADSFGVFVRPMGYPYGTCPGCGYPLTKGGSCLNARCPYSPLYDPEYT